jgi:hypothetical protein
VRKERERGLMALEIWGALGVVYRWRESSKSSSPNEYLQTNCDGLGLCASFVFVFLSDYFCYHSDVSLLTLLLTWRLLTMKTRSRMTYFSLFFFLLTSVTLHLFFFSF